MNKYISRILLLSASVIQPLFGQDGFIDKTGKVVIEARYSDALSFSEGLAPVRVGAKCGYIDRDGKEKIPLQFDNARQFREGRAAVRQGEKWGFIDKEGKWVVEPIYVQVSNFSEGLAAVAIPLVLQRDHQSAETKPKELRSGVRLYLSTRDAGNATGGWGYINTNGKIVISHQFFSVRDFSDGRALVRRRGGREIILSIAEVAPAKISELADYFWEHFEISDDIAWEAAGYIDKTGTMVLPPKYSFAMPFREGLAYVNELFPFSKQKAGLKGYIDTTGKAVLQLHRESLLPGGAYMTAIFESLPTQNQIMGSFHKESVNKWGVAEPFASEPNPMEYQEGLALVDSTAGGFIHTPKWNYVDTSGKVASENVGQFSSRFREGFAAVRKGGPFGGKTGYLGRTGKLVIPYQYKGGGDFSEGLAPVLIDKTWGYIDPTGKVAIEPRFKGAYSFREGLAKVTLAK